MFLSYLQKNFFWFTLVLLTIFATGASYVKFVSIHDYTIYDEIECDPYTASCFLYCEDEECTEPFYYAEIIRQANNYVAYCGSTDYFDCDASYGCMEEESECEVTFCESSPESECYSFSDINSNQN